MTPTLTRRGWRYEAAHFIEIIFSLTLRPVEKEQRDKKRSFRRRKGKTTSKFCVSHVEI